VLTGSSDTRRRRWDQNVNKSKCTVAKSSLLCSLSWKLGWSLTCRWQEVGLLGVPFGGGRNREAGSYSHTPTNSGQRCSGSGCWGTRGPLRDPCGTSPLYRHSCNGFPLLQNTVRAIECLRDRVVLSTNRKPVSWTQVEIKGPITNAANQGHEPPVSCGPWLVEGMNRRLQEYLEGLPPNHRHRVWT
jgi:hypothetical protein